MIDSHSCAREYRVAIPPRNGPFGGSSADVVWHATHPSFVNSSFPLSASPLSLVATATTWSYDIFSISAELDPAAATADAVPDLFNPSCSAVALAADATCGFAD